MKSRENSKKLRKFSSKDLRIIYSTANSAICSRNTSPASTLVTQVLQRKISKLEHKLSKAKATILKYKQEKNTEKSNQQDFLKLYHLKMFALQESSENRKNSNYIDEKVIQERNAIEAIWQRRYDEMKKLYEKKLIETRRKEKLCSKCKVFVKVNEEISKKSKAYHSLVNSKVFESEDDIILPFR